MHALQSPNHKPTFPDAIIIIISKNMRLVETVGRRCLSWAACCGGWASVTKPRRGEGTASVHPPPSHCLEGSLSAAAAVRSQSLDNRVLVPHLHHR